MSETTLGVVIVAFNSGEEVLDCAESLLSAGRAAGVGLRVVVVDNASSDDTVSQLRDWASGAEPYAVPGDVPFAMAALPKPLTLAEGGPDMMPDRQVDVALIHVAENRGFAGGVNVGLAYLAKFGEIAHFWILNPDSMTPPSALTALAARLALGETYGLMGGRVCYLETPDRIQIDGGTLDMRTGVTGNLNLGASAKTTPPPDLSQIDFIMGASMIASRVFYETVGPMREDYFLYYEEVDWAMRRGNLPLAYCEGLVIYHRAGTAIGSPGLGRPASPFSLYFKHRGRMRFLRRFNRKAILSGYAYTLAFALRRIKWHKPAGSWAVLTGAFGLTAPAAIRDRLKGPAAQLAFQPLVDEKTGHLI